MKLPLNREQLRVVLFLLAFLTLSVGMLVTSGAREEAGNQTGNTTSGENTAGLPSPTPKGYKLSTADGTIVYGLWNASVGSQIRMVNSDGTNDFQIATLPADIKDVHVLSSSALLYIAEVDALDHGKTIELYSLTGRKSKSIVKANEGWFIDDVIVSPDKDYIAWWEVKFAPYQKRLLNGQSRVYLKNINTDETFQVTDELATAETPIHYPFFFDHNNRLFLDTFIPNQGRAFYLGVEYVTDESPKELHAVAALSRGKFSSEIELSPVQNLAVYTGFDYTARPLSENKFYEKIKRPELDNPNQIVLLDVDTLTSTVIADGKQGKRYGNLIFSSDGDYILYTTETLTVEDNELDLSVDYKIGVYSVGDKTTAYLDYPVKKALKIIDYKNGKLVYGEKEGGQPANLGNKYASKISFSGNKKMQFLTYLPKKPKAGQLIALDAAIEPTQQRDETIQFTELIVPQDKILDSRLDMQNNPKTMENKTINPDSPTPLPPTATVPPSPTVDPCAGAAWCGTCCQLAEYLCGVPCDYVDYSSGEGRRCDAYENHDSYYKCYDSPLYLYPEKTTQVEVKPKVGKRIYYSNPKLVEDAWKVTADPSGAKIDYFYFSIDVPDPERGIVASYEELPRILKIYADKVGLKGREVDDFVTFWLKELAKFSKPYFFISHYDRETAAKIMSFEIEPKPDTFMQVIMYFKALSHSFNVAPPDFEDIPLRRGFTAVDWSGKIEP